MVADVKGAVSIRQLVEVMSFAILGVLSRFSRCRAYVLQLLDVGLVHPTVNARTILTVFVSGRWFAFLRH
jgi:hypothetical protein